MRLALCGLPLLPACPSPPTTSPPPTTTPSPTPAPAPIVAAGARYDGREGTRWSAEVIVAPDGTNLAAFDLGFEHGHCSNGDPYGSALGGRILSGGSISASGQASFATGYQKGGFYYTPKGKKITGRDEMHFTVQFSGDRVAGMLYDTFLARGLSCSSGAVPFTAYLDGTPQAPLLTKRIETGKYSGSDFHLSTFMPQDWVTSVSFHWRVVCPAKTFPQSSKFEFLSIRGRQFAIQGKEHGHSKGGLTYYSYFRLFGQFFTDTTPTATGEKVRYGVSADWGWGETVYKNGRKLGTCSAYQSYTAYAPAVRTESVG